MRVLISVDMEGIAGVVDPDDVTPGHPEYERNRVLMTAEASAAVRGVLAADPAASVLVTNVHAAFRNLLPAELDRRAETLCVASPATGGWRVAENVDATLFISYHGRAGTFRSVLAHTINGGVVADVRCNGRSLGELGPNAALAASACGPAVLVAGDDEDAAEAADVAPGMHAVIVKRALGRHGRGFAASGRSVRPDRAGSPCRRRSPTATLVGAPAFDGPVELEVEVFRPRQAERALLVPGVRLHGNSRTLRYLRPDFPPAYRMIQLIVILGGS